MEAEGGEEMNQHNDDNLAVYAAAMDMRAITRRRQMMALERRREAIRRQWWRKLLPTLRRIRLRALASVALLEAGVILGLLIAGWFW